MSVTAADKRFAELVANGTGLDRRVVLAWVNAEGGPDSNPLNIMGWQAGRRYVRDYGSTEQAAAATVRLLQSNTYAALARTARDPRATVTDELQAIISSPWEETGYSGGRLLVGSYRALFGPASLKAPAGTASTAAGAGSAQLAGVYINPLDPFGLIPDPGDYLDDLWGFGLDKLGISGWVADIARWVETRAALAALYLLFTVAALLLVVMGLGRSAGITPASALGVVRARPRASDIPY